MAEIEQDRKHLLIVIVRTTLIALLVFLAIRELYPNMPIWPKLPSDIRRTMSEIKNAQQLAISSDTSYAVTFDVGKDSLLVAPKDAAQDSPAGETYSLGKSFDLVSITFESARLVFGPDGKPSQGGEIEIRRGEDKSFFIEVSPSGRDVWLKDPQYTTYNRFGAWIGAICVVAIFSYLYRENQFYRVFEHILLGISLGFTAAIVSYQELYTKWWKGMVNDGFVKLFAGDYASQPDLNQVLQNSCLIFAGIVGILWYFQYSKKYLWLNRIAVGITAGAAAGLGIKNTLVSRWPQITGTFKNLFISRGFAPNLGDSERWLAGLEGLLFIVIVCCVLYYFFFSFRRQTSKSKTPANMGRMFLMISLGAFFGNTFLTRVVILIDRVQFLIGDWLLIR